MIKVYILIVLCYFSTYAFYLKNCNSSPFTVFDPRYSQELLRVTKEHESAKQNPNLTRDVDIIRRWLQDGDLMSKSDNYKCGASEARFTSAKEVAEIIIRKVKQDGIPEGTLESYYMFFENLDKDKDSSWQPKQLYMELFRMFQPFIRNLNPNTDVEYLNNDRLAVSYCNNDSDCKRIQSSTQCVRNTCK